MKRTLKFAGLLTSFLSIPYAFASSRVECNLFAGDNLSFKVGPIVIDANDPSTQRINSLDASQYGFKGVVEVDLNSRQITSMTMKIIQGNTVVSQKNYSASDLGLGEGKNIGAGDNVLLRCDIRR